MFEYKDPAGSWHRVEATFWTIEYGGTLSFYMNVPWKRVSSIPNGQWMGVREVHDGSA